MMSLESVSLIAGREEARPGGRADGRAGWLAGCGDWAGEDLHHRTDCQIKSRRVGARGKSTKIREMGVEDKGEISKFKKHGEVNCRGEKHE